MSNPPARDYPRTLWQLLGEYRVKIPIIQRDYAQGRNSPKIDQLRADFLDAIADALQPQAREHLDLGLIYGTVDTDTSGLPPPAGAGLAGATGNAVAGHALPDLLLLDGQQRLTTSFLLHWYLAWRGVKPDQRVEVVRRLGHFTYDTRTSAREFCGVLATRGLDLAIDTPSKVINDAPWYPSSWSQDPTIGAMLVMLDDIHEKFHKEDCTSRWICLLNEEKPTIFFQFLPMSDHQLTDDLYLKLNARGRSLTDFEKFKAWLERHVEHSEDFTLSDREALGAQWQMEIDKEWADFFWRYSGGDPAKMDAVFLRFFKEVAWNTLVAASGTIQDADVAEAVTNDSFMPTDLLVRLFTPRALRDLFIVLRQLGGGGLERLEQWTLFAAFVAGEPTYKTRLVFHALCRYLVEHRDTPGEPRPDAIRRWLRVIGHLAEHTPMGGEEFSRALATIQRIAPAASADIFRWLADGGFDLRGFYGYQAKEERRKADLVQSRATGWEEAIVEAEDHSFFKGQITFLLDLANESGDGSENLEQFRNYAALARKIFTRDGGLLDHPEHLVHRALLTKGDYLFSYKGNIWLFDEVSSRWRTDIFQKSNYVTVVHALLHDLLPRVQQGHGEEAALREIIAEGIARPWKNNPAEDWRRLIARCPAAISFCQQKKVRFIDDPVGRYIVLMKQQKFSKNGEYADLRMYCFHQDYLEPARVSFAPLVLDWDYHTLSTTQVTHLYPLPYARLSGLGFQINIQYLVLGNNPAQLYRIELTALDDRPFYPVAAGSFLSMKGQFDPTMTSAGIARFHYAEETDVWSDLLQLVDAIRAPSPLLNIVPTPIIG